jgi:hypothetical protein
MGKHRLYYLLMRRRLIHRNKYLNSAHLLFSILSLWMKIMSKYMFLSRYLWMDSSKLEMMSTHQI